MSDLDQFRPIQGRDDIYDRARQKPDWTGIFYPEGRIGQGTAVRDGFTLEGRARTSIGNMIARDGDRVEGAAVRVDRDAETVQLDAGTLYVQGRAREVEARTLAAVPMTGDVTIGVRISSTIIDYVEDADLLGLHPGSAGEGEPGPVVEVQTLAWGFDGDGATGSHVPVYRLIDGVIIDQTPPANLSVAQQALQRFTEESLGGYITRGFDLFALGKVGDAQVFSLAAGSAYIRGQPVTRYQSMRLEELEDPDTGTVAAEPHSFDDDGTGTATITLRRSPVQAVTSAIVTKETVESVLRGSGDTDALSQSGVRAVLSITQGATTYEAGTDFTRVGDTIDWSIGGTAPATGETYDVTYHYLDSVAVDALTADSVTLSGGVTGELVLIAYAFKLPRIDRLCLDEKGLPVYLKGVSSALNALAPAVPDKLLKIATIHNDWRGAPDIEPDGVRNITFEEQWRFFQTVERLQDLMGIERLRRDLDGREPVAKQGIMVDPLWDDRYRDSGEEQTAAVFDGGMELPIEALFEDIDLGAPQLLAFTEEVVVAQTLSSGCMPINPYQVFVPPPAQMSITPATDFWEDNQTQWAGDITRTFGQGDRSAVESVVTERVGTTQRQATFLRQIPVTFTIDGMGAGENLEALEFDGVDVTPAGLSANGSGILTGSFTIPANIPTGTKAVAAYGEGGSFAAAEFVGEGIINTQTLRRVTTIRRWTDPRPQRNEPNNDSEEASADPLAQTFMLGQDRMLTGINVQFCAIGDRDNASFVELVTVENGIPTTNRIAQAEIDMQQVVVGQWTQARFAIPIFVPASTEYAFVFKTDDADHALRIATRGDFMEDVQEFVGAQPYIVGVLLSSSNARTWTPHQNSDLTMQIEAAVFDPTTRTIDMGTIAGVTDVSDLVIRAGVDLPTAAARCVFEIELDDTTVYRVEPGQPLRLDAFYSGDLKLRAVLTGSRTITPILFPHVLVLLGTLQAEGTYVSRAFALGDAIRLTARMKTFLPTGATLSVEHDAADDSWHELTAGTVEAIEQGWQERRFDREPITANQGRLRLTLTGNPAARPVVSDLRTASI